VVKIEKIFGVLIGLSILWVFWSVALLLPALGLHVIFQKQWSLTIVEILGIAGLLPFFLWGFCLVVGIAVAMTRGFLYPGEVESDAGEWYY